MRARGFTLIELLVTLAVVALLVALAAPRFLGSVTRAEEAALRHNLAALRDAIDKHYSDTGKYPVSLDELVSKKYLRALPEDPVTRSAASWVILPPADPQLGAVFDVKSGAAGTASDGRTYAEW